MLLLAPYMKEANLMYKFSVEALLCNDLITHIQFGKAEDTMNLWKDSTMEMAYLLGNRRDLSCKQLKNVLESLMTKYEAHLERCIAIAIRNSLKEREAEDVLLHSEILH
jgi:hypothetical protein